MLYKYGDKVSNQEIRMYSRGQLDDQGPVSIWKPPFLAYDSRQKNKTVARLLIIVCHQTFAFDYILDANLYINWMLIHVYVAIWGH